MIRRIFISLVLLVSCSGPLDEGAAGAAGTVAEPQAGPSTFCEFTLRSPPPQLLSPTKVTRVQTEGDDRIFADYQACEGRVPITVELRDTPVWSIRIRGVGNCIEDSVCVGDTYQQSTERFPTARQLISREEGKTFSLLVRDGLTLIFPAESLADECFARPDSCTEQIQQSQVEAIFLYDR
jgi:hypothetical protein